MYYCVKLFRCEASMSVLIQNASRANMRKFKDFKEYPAVIRIWNAHNHSIASADALKELRVLSDVQQAFYQYFEQGIDLSLNHLSK